MKLVKKKKNGGKDVGGKGREWIFEKYDPFNRASRSCFLGKS